MQTIVGYRRTILVLDFRQSFTRPETFLTAAYLHLTNQHLFGNLLGYALVAVYTYLL